MIELLKTIILSIPPPLMKNLQVHYLVQEHMEIALYDDGGPPERFIVHVDDWVDSDISGDGDIDEQCVHCDEKATTRMTFTQCAMLVECEGASYCDSCVVSLQRYIKQCMPLVVLFRYYVGIAPRRLRERRMKDGECLYCEQHKMMYGCKYRGYHGYVKRIDCCKSCFIASHLLSAKNKYRKKYTLLFRMIAHADIRRVCGLMYLTVDKVVR